MKLTAKAALPKRTLPCPHCGHVIDANFPHHYDWIPKDLLLACPSCRKMFTISRKALAAARANFFNDYIATPVLYFFVALAVGISGCGVLLYLLTPR